MSYNAGISYRDKFRVRVVTTSSAGFIVSNVTLKFRKFRDHSLKAKIGLVVLFLFTI